MFSDVCVLPEIVSEQADVIIGIRGNSEVRSD